MKKWFSSVSIALIFCSSILFIHAAEVNENFYVEKIPGRSIWLVAERVTSLNHQEICCESRIIFVM
jgi:hypothetical protein